MVRPHSTLRRPAAEDEWSRCDPIYQWEAAQLGERIAVTSAEVLEQTRRNAAEFVWGKGIASVEELGQVRMRAMRIFPWRGATRHPRPFALDKVSARVMIGA